MSRRPLAPIVAIAILVAGHCALAEDGAPSVEVQTVPLRRQELQSIIPTFGTVAITEESTIDISFPHPGQITALDVRAGQQVRAGDPLVTITADPAASQSYAKARADLDFANRQLTRQQTLRAQHLATNAQVATAQKAVVDATVALETERKLGNDQPTKMAPAPFDGYVAKLMAARGDRLQANTAIMQIARTDQGLRVTAGLKPEDATRVMPGMQAELKPVATPKSGGVPGRMRQISGTINPTTKLLDAWIDVTRKGTLVPGMAVSVDIVLSRHEGWVVPRNAVLHDQKGSYVFQVAGGHARRVDVKTGIETDELTEISGALDPSLRVVASGNYELHDGMTVREAAASP